MLSYKIKYGLNLTVLLVTLSWSQFSLASVDECKLQSGELHRSDERLASASNSMWDKFETTCETSDRCVLNVGQETAVTHLNYMHLRGTDEYEAVKKACVNLHEDDSSTALCKVNSELEVPNNNKPVFFYAKAEPICFAFQCAEKQVDLVERSPLGCDPETQSCVIHSEEAHCPDRGDGSGQGNCRLYQKRIEDDETYQNAKTALNNLAGSYCDANEDSDDEICSYEVKPIQITVGENFREFEYDDTFLEYEDACYDAGGQTCYMSLSSRIVGKVVLFDLDVTGDYNDFPACFPADCEHKDKEKIAKERLAENMASKISNSLQDMMVRRQLTEIDEHSAGLQEHIKRVLQSDEKDEPCPLGMELCDTKVVDFFCTGSDGIPVEVVNLKAAPESSSSSLSAATGLFLATMAGGGLLL